MRDPEFVQKTIEQCEEDKRQREREKKKERRMIILSVLVLVLLLGGLGYLGLQYIHYSNTSASADTRLEEMGIKDQSDLDFAAYEKDYAAGVAAANKKYQGQTVTITGEVTSKPTVALMAVSDEASVLIKKTVNGTNLSIVAKFNQEDMAMLKTVKVGDVLTFTGECNNEYSFANCKVVEVVTPDGEE